MEAVRSTVPGPVGPLGRPFLRPFASPFARPVALGFITLVLTGCASLSRELPPPVAAVLAQSGVPASSLAVVAFPLDAPTRGLRLNADQPMQGASTMKLLTAAAALDRLGPNSRGRTELLVDGDPAAAPPAVASPDGRLQTPLYLKGGADADLDWSALWFMLRDLRERHGVRELAGGVVVDRSLFRPARPELGAPDFDEQPEFPYNVIPDALNLNGSLLSYDLNADGQRLQVRPFPAFGGLDIDTQAMAISDQPCGNWDEGWQIPQVTPQVSPQADNTRLILRGTFPRGCEVRQSLNALDRQWVTGQALRQLWTSLGGTITGEIREGVTPTQTRVLVRHQDRPLAELLRPVLKSSDNATTRLIFQRLGAASAQPGEDTLVAAQRAVKDWLATQGVDPRGVVLENGAGLSRVERISAAQMATLLQAVQRGPHGPELLATLPVAGVDGTLVRRFKGTPAEGRARMKTGTLRDVVALAGYVPDASGRLWVMVGVVNDARAAAARPVLDALVVWLAGH